MKKHWLKKAMCVALAVSMTAGLCACGGGGGGGIGGGGVKGGSETQDPSLAKQYVYSCQDFELPDMGSDNYNLNSMARVKDRVYMLAYIYHWKEEDGQEEDEFRLFSVNLDGGDLQETKLELPKSGQEDGQEDSGASDNADTAAGAASVTSEAGIASDEIGIDEVIGDVYEYTNYYRFDFSEEGLLYAVKNYSYENYTDPENPVRKSEYSICAWNLDGSLRFEQPLEILSGEDNNTNLQASAVSSSGTYLMVTYNWDTQEAFMMTVDSEGNVTAGDQPLEDEQGVFTNLSEAYAGNDDQIYFFYYDEEDNYNTYIAKYDVKTKSFVGEGVRMPDSLYYNGYRDVAMGEGDDIIFSSSDGVYLYHFGGSDVTRLMSFTNSDLDTNNMAQVVPLDENRFFGYYYDRMEYKPLAGIFTKVDPEDIPDKEVIVVAGESLPYDLLHRVVEYNRNSDTYRIVTKTYDSFITADDYMAGYTQLNADILAGNMPDILYVDYNTDVSKYISKGLLADVGALIENDEELSQTAFMENVFNAFRVKGKLYQVYPSFGVRTVVGKRSVLGDRTTWTMQEFNELMASMPEGTMGFGDMTRDDFLTQAFNYCGKDFVDVESGKCNFDSENFIAILEYAASLPEEIDWSQKGDDYWMNYESMYREDKILLTSTSVADPESAVNTINGTFGEDVAYVGFPTDSGQGSYIYSESSYVLSAKSANLEGAWEFIRYYLTPEYQDEIMWMLPVREDSFMKYMQKAMQKPWYEDENGEKVEYDYSYWINGESITIDPLTQEQLDQLIGFIRSVDKAQYNNEDLWNIVKEEAEAFFSGQKSVQDVAGIIQNRAQVYVNENS